MPPPAVWVAAPQRRNAVAAEAVLATVAAVVLELVGSLPIGTVGPVSCLQCWLSQLATLVSHCPTALESGRPGLQQSAAPH